jgi:hypothetical protein
MEKQEYTNAQAFIDGFEQCKAQVTDIIMNPKFKNRTEMAEAVRLSTACDNYEDYGRQSPKGADAGGQLG